MTKPQQARGSTDLWGLDQLKPNDQVVTKDEFHWFIAIAGSTEEFVRCAVKFFTHQLLFEDTTSENVLTYFSFPSLFIDLIN